MWPKLVGEAYVDENGNMVGVSQKAADAFVLKFAEAATNSPHRIIIDSLNTGASAEPDVPVIYLPKRGGEARDRKKAKAARKARKKQRKS